MIVGSGQDAGERPPVQVPHDPNARGAAGKPVETAIAGGQGGGHYVSQMPDPPQNVVGFRVKIGNWGNKPIINKFDCLYDRQDDGQADVVMAKRGYVVGGMLADTDEYVHALKIIFVRECNGVLDPKDRYLTPWIGTPSSGSAPKQFAGHGERVVGVCGHKGMNYDAIGLMIIP